MKNLLIYINPNGFDEKNEKIAELQINNSLELGWKVEDIVLVTNFPYEYRGVKAVQVSNGTFCKWHPPVSKIFVIMELFARDFFKDELWWFHDMDAYQQEWITEEELELEGFDMGYTDYGRKPNWNTGSLWFRKSAEDLFREASKRVTPKLDQFKRVMHEETVFYYMQQENFNNMNKRIKRLNNTYNFGMRRLGFCYDIALKPLKVLHFHPEKMHHETTSALEIAMGDNELKKKFISDRLIKYFII